MALTGLTRADVGELDRDAAAGGATSSCLEAGVTVFEFATTRGGTTVEFWEVIDVDEGAGADFGPVNPGKLNPNPFNADPTSTILINTVQLMLT